MIAMVQEQRIQQLADECIHLSERTEDTYRFRIAGALVPHPPTGDPDTAHLERAHSQNALASPSAEHEHGHAGCRDDREIVI
jgi:hypothetical protein